MLWNPMERSFVLEIGIAYDVDWADFWPKYTTFVDNDDDFLIYEYDASLLDHLLCWLLLPCQLSAWSHKIIIINIIATCVHVLTLISSITISNRSSNFLFCFTQPHCWVDALIPLSSLSCLLSMFPNFLTFPHLPPPLSLLDALYLGLSASPSFSVNAFPLVLVYSTFNRTQ